MYFLVKNFYEDLMMIPKLYIYGAGDYANRVYLMMKKLKMDKNIKSFIISKVDNDYLNIDGIKIESFEKIKDLDLRKTTILIAVSDKYMEEIKRKIQRIEFNKILLITDYIISEEKAIDRLKGASKELLFRYISEWFISNHLPSVEMFKLENEKIQRRLEVLYIEKQKLEIEKQTIVFIIGDLKPRIVKIISSLCRRKFKIIVLGYGGMNDFLTKKELLENDIEIFECVNIEEMFYYAMQYNPIVYYFVPVWGDCRWAAIMIKHKEIFGKIVISLYDILNDGVSPEASESSKNVERYCIENACGIVWRSFSKKYLEEKKGFKYKGKSIQFLDYCNEYNVKEKKERSSELKLCFVTGVLTGFCGKINRYSGYVQEATIEDILETIGDRNDCIFHVYSGNHFNEKDKEICEMLERRYSNFRVIYNTEHKKLIEILSDYDYGCFFFTDGKSIPDTITVNGSCYGSEYNNCISNRFFDYIEAGIPIVATRPTKLCEVFGKYGVVVNMNTSNLDINYLKLNRVEYKKNVKKARKEFMIDNQIQRLIDFFDNL